MPNIWGKIGFSDFQEWNKKSFPKMQEKKKLKIIILLGSWTSGAQKSFKN